MSSETTFLVFFVLYCGKIDVRPEYSLCLNYCKKDST